jgi:hypothetical protein
MTVFWAHRNIRQRKSTALKKGVVKAGFRFLIAPTVVRLSA